MAESCPGNLETSNWSWTQRETPSFDDPALEVAGCLRGEVLMLSADLAWVVSAGVKLPR